MLRVILCTTLAYLAATSSVGDEKTGDEINPTKESARDNANSIFNGIHSVGRLWDTAVHHNGFALIPGAIPAGTLLYHGTGQRQPPETLEWLAFDVEHAEFFSQRVAMMKRSTATRLHPQDKTPAKSRDQKPLAVPPGHSCLQSLGEEKDTDGFLQTYQAARDLNVLILDGMSAAIWDWSGDGAGGGDLFQLLILNTDAGQEDDDSANASMGRDHKANPERLYRHARQACKVATNLGFDAIFRAEAGFELVYCDFQADGLNLVSNVPQIPLQERFGGVWDSVYEWTRAVSHRYDGIGLDRLRIDFSSMVSGLFFPFNYSSPLKDGSNGKRLMAAGEENLHRLNHYALDSLRSRDRFTVNWQAVVESIVDRYSDKLRALTVPNITAQLFAMEVGAVAMTYLSADVSDGGTLRERNRTADAVALCTRMYLQPALVSQKRWSRTDDLLFTAVETVTHSICHEYYRIYTMLTEAVPREPFASSCGVKHHIQATAELDSVIEDAKETIRQLMKRLDWASWRKPRLCKGDEFLYIAMFPYGAHDDHWNPGCRPPNYFEDMKSDYWV